MVNCDCLRRGARLCNSAICTSFWYCLRRVAGENPLRWVTSGFYGPPHSMWGRPCWSGDRPSSAVHLAVASPVAAAAAAAIAVTVAAATVSADSVAASAAFSAVLVASAAAASAVEALTAGASVAVDLASTASAVALLLTAVGLVPVKVASSACPYRRPYQWRAPLP